MEFKDKYRDLQELIREHTLIRDHNKEIKEGESQDKLLLFSEASLILVILERFLRILPGCQATDTDTLPNLLEKATSKSRKVLQLKITEKNALIIRAFKKVLSDKVKDVKISHSLTQSPACISIEEGAMDIKMERILLEQNQLKYASKKILEINPNHSLVLKAVKNVHEKADNIDDENKDLILTIYEMASLAEGEMISNPGLFVRRLISIINN
jgi:HSP90 family molecular chaperone